MKDSDDRENIKIKLRWNVLIIALMDLLFSFILWITSKIQKQDNISNQIILII